MAESLIRQQIIHQLDQLTPAQQQQLLDFAIHIQGSLPPGIPGEDLIALARQIDFPADDLAEIMRAVNEDCERIDADGWQ